MTEVPDVCMFMRRVGPFHEEQMSAFARHTKESFNLIYVYEPDTTSYQAVTQAFARSTSRYLLLIDDDVIPLDDGWISAVIGVLQRHQELGAVSAFELRTQELVDEYLANREAFRAKGAGTILQSTSLSGLMAFDRARVPDLYSEEGFPGRYGMNDADLAFQVHKAGLQSAFTCLTCVKHLWKPDGQREWRLANDIIPQDEEPHWHELHKQFMRKKWGRYFDENWPNRFLRVIESLPDQPRDELFEMMVTIEDTFSK